MSPINSLSPLDGRYSKQTLDLATVFSERGLITYRTRVEGEYLIALSERGIARGFTPEERGLIRSLSDIHTQDTETVKQIEVAGYEDIPPTNHDVKAVEYYLRKKLADTSLSDCLHWIHFALTSEDVNSFAYGLMISDGLEKILLPSLETLYTTIEALADRYKGLPMLARTHGQPASPTTVGKEFKVFSSRIERQLDQLRKYEAPVKLNGATGNYSAHVAAFPDVDWIQFTQDFAERFGERKIKLIPTLVTTQIEPHDRYAELFDNLRRINTILIDFAQDMWRYISDDWIVQKPKEGEVGSSTMPHKVNPIDFENAEGNFGLANAMFDFFSRKLPVSRLQRDLSDSTVLRNIGSAFGHALIGYNSLQRGLGKIQVNEGKILEDLDQHPEVILEAVQTILRREGKPDAYEQLKGFSRGKKLTTEDIQRFIESLDVPEPVKEEMRKINTRNYIGLTERLVDS